MHPRASFAVLGLCALAFAQSCKTKNAPPDPTPAASSSARMAPTTASATAPAPSSTPPSAPAASSAPLRGPECGAKETAKPLHLGTHNSRLQGLAVDSTGLYAIATEAGDHRYVLYHVAKDGSRIHDILRFKSSISRQVFVDPSGVYFSKREGSYISGTDALMRVSREGGAPEVVAEHFGHLEAVYEGYAYGVHTAVLQGKEDVLRVPLQGGEVTTLLHRKLAPVGYRGSIFRIDRLVVGSAGVIFSDEGRGVISKMGVTGGSSVDLTSGVFAPDDLLLGGDRVYFHNTAYSVRTDGAGFRIADDFFEIWTTAQDGKTLYCFGQDKAGTPRLGVLGEEGNHLWKDRLAEIHMRAAVADDKCLYYVRNDYAGIAFYSAIPKPEPH